MGKTTEEFNEKMGIKVNVNIPPLKLSDQISKIEKSVSERKMYKNRTEMKIET